VATSDWARSRSALRGCLLMEAASGSCEVTQQAGGQYHGTNANVETLRITDEATFQYYTLRCSCGGMMHMTASAAPEVNRWPIGIFAQPPIM
jgi:hypothetical protein